MANIVDAINNAFGNNQVTKAPSSVGGLGSIFDGVGDFAKNYGETILGLGKLGLDYRADREQNKLSKDAFNFNRAQIERDNALQDNANTAAGEALADSGLLDAYGNKKKNQTSSSGLGSI